MKKGRDGRWPGWTAVACLLAVVGCGATATDEAERAGPTVVARDPPPIAAAAPAPPPATPPITAAAPAPSPVTVGAPCSPDPAEARGTTVTGYHCDDLREPARPVWRAGPPSLGWFDVTAVAAERSARPGDDDSPPGRTRFEQCELVGNTGFGVLARGPGHVMTGGTVRNNGSGQGRAGIRTLGPAEGLVVEGTRFADGGS